MERSVGTPVAKQEYLSQAQPSDMLLILKTKILSGFHFCTYMHTTVEETKEHIRELFFFFLLLANMHSHKHKLEEIEQMLLN